jgi:hypothetical protein
MEEKAEMSSSPPFALESQLNQVAAALKYLIDLNQYEPFIKKPEKIKSKKKRSEANKKSQKLSSLF